MNTTKTPRDFVGNWLVKYSQRHAARAHRLALTLCEPVCGATMMDVGCGDGSFTAEVAKKVGATTVVGIDLMPDKIDALQRKGIKGIQADLNARFPADDGSIDILLASQVIEHVNNTDFFVAEMFRVLKPGGYAIVATPNLAALYNIGFLLLGKQPPVTSVSDVVGAVGSWDQALVRTYGEYVFPRHRRIFTWGSFVGLLEHYGFKCEKKAASGFPPFPWFAADLACRFFPCYAWNLIVRARKTQ